MGASISQYPHRRLTYQLHVNQRFRPRQKRLMLKAFEISTPLPARGSAVALRRQLVDHLLRIKPDVGERFLSDHELSRIAGLSRPTVRRALDDLEREGWIERRPGIGTFIGPRAAVTLDFRHDDDGNGHGTTAKRTTRLA